MPARILVVDDDERVRRLLCALLEGGADSVTTAADGSSALDAVDRIRPDLVLLDVHMPCLGGIEICRTLKSQPETRLLPVVLITGAHDGDAKRRGIEAGADDFITKPFNRHELRARIRSLIDNKRYTDELDTTESVLISLALTIEARDWMTDGHCQRLASYAQSLGVRIGLDEEQLITLRRGAYLHDIGKIGIPDAILLKPDPLTREEHAQMQTHTLIGDRLCAGLRSLGRVRGIVRGHHERLDGSGYPDGLRGDAIPILTQIIGIVDVFDALVTERPYKKAFSVERAHEELLREVDRGWRLRDLVVAFANLDIEGNGHEQAGA
jgi:putative two-component system response regulator